LIDRLIALQSVLIEQLAQLPQRHRATAAWVPFGQKWKTIFCTYYRSSFTPCDEIDPQSYRIWWNNAK